MTYLMELILNYQLKSLGNYWSKKLQENYQYLENIVEINLI